ncbi:MAG TPA: metal-dependent hydrolase [Acidobacteriaceae bacterium]|nr:metal-dependent hydrolase [Acidobacteriaceae bacterium]
MIRITWLGHAAFELQFDSGQVLLLDPWIDGNPAYPKGYEIAKADAIAVTHGHGDHLGSVVPLAKKFGAKVVAMVEVAGWVASKGVKETIGFNKGGTVDLGFVKVTMTHALHSSSIDDNGKAVYGGEPAGYILTFKDGRRAYFAGDTAVFSEMALYAEIYHPELAFLPIGDHYTMGPEEAAYAGRLLKVKEIIPMHYGTFPLLKGTPQQLEQQLSGSGIKVLPIKQGQSISW